MKVTEVVHRLGWLEAAGLQLVETDDGGEKKNYLLQSGYGAGRVVLFQVPGKAQLNPKSPIPPEAVVVEGDERVRVLCAVAEADNGWDIGDQLEFTREPVTE